MRRLAMTLPLALLACAQAAQTSGDDPVDVARTRTRDDGGFDVDIVSERVAFAYPVAGAPDKVWRAMPDAYRRLNIPVSHLDATARSIGSNGFEVRRRLAGEPVSRFLECGRTIAGPKADTYTVWLRVVTTLVAVDSGSTSLSTEVTGSAADPTVGAGSANRVVCASQGTLEERIAIAAREALLGAR